MSYISSSRKSSTPSILRKPNKPKSSPGPRVRFQLDNLNNLKVLLLNYVQEKNKDAYVELVCKIRDAGIQLTDDDLIQIISEARECISILDENLKLFVQVLLILKWVRRSDEAVLQYKNFLLDVCSAHNYYTKFALQQLVATFSDVIEESFHENCLPSEQEERGFQHAHETIRSLLKLIPMSREVLLNIIKRKFPFRTESAQCHLNYIHNALNVTSYEPTLRREILVLIITKLIHLDTIASKNEIEKSENSNDIKLDCSSDPVFSMEIDDITCDDDMKHEIARKLDYSLHRLYKYIHAECHDKNGVMKWDKLKSLYTDFLFIFENVLLPTFGSCHTQFVLFYLMNFNRKLTEDFISYLWNKVKNKNVAPVMRQAAACYISGILAHGTFVSTITVKNMISDIANWLHQYINTVSDSRDDDNSSVLRVHGVFYALCQALFYLICSRQDELVNSDKDLKFLENLNLGKIVTSRFNPLLICSRSVVNCFAAITKTYQLTYCFSVLNNTDDVTSNLATDLWLDEYFPFECYLLKRSGKVIQPIHRKFKKLSDVSETMECKGEDEEDLIPNCIASSNSPRVPILSSSPFFGFPPSI